MARILLIDDDPQVRMVFEGFLIHDGHEVVTAVNGSEGLKMLEAGPFDLVITDIVMPEQDGYEVIMKLARLEHRPRIIAVSGGSPALSQQMLLKVVTHMPVELVLAKPVSYEELSTAVKNVLNLQ